MDPQGIPIVWASALTKSNKTTFTTFSKEVVVEAPRAVIVKLLDACNGGRKLSEVIDILSQDWDGASIESLLEELFQKQVIHRCCSQLNYEGNLHQFHLNMLNTREENH